MGYFLRIMEKCLHTKTLMQILVTVFKLYGTDIFSYYEWTKKLCSLSVPKGRIISLPEGSDGIMNLHDRTLVRLSPGSPILEAYSHGIYFIS